MVSRREIVGAVLKPDLLDAARSGTSMRFGVPADPPDIDGYVELVGDSGFPEPALRLPSQARQVWLDSYLEHVVTRDVRSAGQVLDPVRLRRYLEVLALSTAGLPADATLSQTAGVDRRTVQAYEHLPSSLFLLDLVTSWSSNRLSRLVQRPKRYLTDSAIAVSAARLAPIDILSDGDLLGRLLDTFVVAQLRPEVALLQPPSRLHHLRTEVGRQEIDLLIDLGGGRVVAVEVKASSAPTARDARHLSWLRGELGEAFVRGLLFHTGPQAFQLGERVWALPIAALWG